MLTTFYPPYNFGGDGIGIQRLSRALVRRGHEVTVMHDVDAYRLLSRSEPGPDTADDGVRRVALESRMGPFSPLLTQQFGYPVANGGKVKRMLSDGRFDVLWYHNVSLIGGPGLLQLGSGLKIYEAHEHWLVCPSHVLWRHRREPCPGRQCLRCVLRHRRPPQIWRTTGLLNRRAREVDAFIAKSEFSRAKHAEFGFRREMEVVPYFLPDSDESISDAGESPHNRPFFLFVGRLEHIKGLDDVIPAFAQYPDADLLIAGDGEHGPFLREAATGVPNVRFLGRVDPDSLSGYYRHAIGLIVPSVCFETFGIIIIESFRQGTPVLTRHIGPFPELIARSGGGETFTSTEELAGSMRRLQFDSALRNRMAESARKAFNSYWCESAVIPQYFAVLARAARRSGRNDLASRLENEVAN